MFIKPTYRSVDVFRTPDFTGLSVRERVAIIDAQFPLPEDERAARKQAVDGLYALGCCGVLMMESLCAQAEWSPLSARDFWTDVAARSESHFQGMFAAMLWRRARTIEDEERRQREKALIRLLNAHADPEDLEEIRDRYRYEEFKDGVGFLQRSLAAVILPKAVCV